MKHNSYFFITQMQISGEIVHEIGIREQSVRFSKGVSESKEIREGT